MRNDLKTRVQICSSIDKKLIKELSKLSQNTRISKSKLLDEAIELLLQKHNAGQ